MTDCVQHSLVVALHGSGGDHYAPCIIGDDREMQDHPAALGINRKRERRLVRLACDR
jgi:hypothetical protein